MSDKIRVLIIDDEEDMRWSIAQFMALSGFETESFELASKALSELTPRTDAVIISDIRMPGMDGMELLRRIHAIDSALPVILITGHGDVGMAVEAMRIGAYDFIEKPFDPERLAELVRRAGQTRRLTLENRALRRDLTDGATLARRLIGETPQMEALRETILNYAQADSPVMIRGETGTGKSLVAHALHACGPKQGSPFETVDCAAHTPERLSTLLLGEGEGVLHQCHGGTICLENVDRLSPELQRGVLAAVAKIETAAALEQPALRLFTTITRPRTGEEPPQGGLSEDLALRLGSLTIELPALRERGEDILILFNRFLQQFSEEYGQDAPEISASDAALLLSADWPGNVRQAIGLAERAVLQAHRSGTNLSSLLSEETKTEAPPARSDRPLKDHVEAFEKMLIEGALRRHRGSIAAVMEELSVPRRTLNEKMAKYALSRSSFT